MNDPKTNMKMTHRRGGVCFSRCSIVEGAGEALAETEGVILYTTQKLVMRGLPRCKAPTKRL